MPDEIENLGKGGFRDPTDIRDFKAETVFGAPMVDWHNPLNGNRWQRVSFWRNQKSSLSCGGQSAAYLVDLLYKFPTNVFSAKSLYAFTHLSSGGSFIRDNMMRIIKNGIARQSEVPDPLGSQATETNYRKKEGITPDKLEPYKQKSAFVLDGKSIDWVAWGIENYDGVVYGLNGNNKDWVNRVYPKPPNQVPGTSPEWAHLICAADFHICNDGQKCIISLSSWVDQGGNINLKVHHIKENYFLSGHTFNPWVVIPKGDFRMLVFFRDKSDVNKTVWLLADGEWLGFTSLQVFTDYLNGRPHQIIDIDHDQFVKIKNNPEMI